jgi:hypothetical protein
MRTSVLKSLVGALMLGALLCAPTRADSQAEKPVVVISAAGYNALMADLGCFGEIAGQPGLDKSIDAILTLATGGRGLADVDKARPWGIAICPGDGKPTGYGFVPVTDLKALLGLLEDLGHKSSDAGNGIIEIDTKQDGKRLFVREGKGWAFVADRAESLADLPDDPGKLVTGVAKQYDLAVQLNLCNVSAQDRGKLLKALKTQARKGLDKAEVTDAQKAVLRMIAQRVFSGIEVVAEELERITIGASLDAEAKTASVEVSVTALQGTGAATALAQLKQSPTNLAGFQLPDAALTAGSAVYCPGIDTDVVAALFHTIKAVAFSGIDKEIDSEQKAEGAKRFVGELLDVAAETVATGRLDRRMSLVLNPGGVTLVGASHVADGFELEQTLGMLVEVARNKYGGDVDRFLTPNADEYKGVRLHVLSVPIPYDFRHRDEVIPMEGVIALVGERLEVVFGVTDEAVGFAVGRNAMKTMKQAIDESIASPQQATPPAHFSVSLSRVVDFLAVVAEEKDKPVIKGAAAILEESPGKDHITAVVKPINRGFSYQVQIEEGLLELLVEAQKLKMKRN